VLKQPNLGGAFKYVLCSPPILGKMIQFDLRIVLQMACFKPPTTNKFKQSAAGDFGITGRDAEIAGFLTPKKSGLPKKDF